MERSETSLISPFDDLGLKEDTANALSNLNSVLSQIRALSHELVFNLSFENGVKNYVNSG